MFDGDQGEAYHGEDYFVVSPTRVRVNLYFESQYAGPGVTLGTVGETGIAAANDGLAWGGVTGIVLPFFALEKRAA